jgi:hypothetical protein
LKNKLPCGYRSWVGNMAIIQAWVGGVVALKHIRKIVDRVSDPERQINQKKFSERGN